MVVKEKQIDYYKAFLADSGDYMLLLLETSADLNIDDVITVADNYASYDFLVCAKRKDFIYYCVPKILSDLIKVIFDKSFKQDTSLKAIVDALNSNSLYRVVNDFSVLNFTFAGDGRQFLGFCRMQYGLSYYLSKDAVILYKDLEELEVKRHRITIFDHDLIDINLSVRAFDFINDKRISKIFHYSNKNYSQVMFVEQNICFNRG
ncbi:hypothetical protein F0310_04575 (plasmid) [Borrelia sp. A-FGy1]|uniref:hypothetical protein n=1 Tax=Borrelia sp. A-FGy1 TaxID=2608247 RepID=UPI0015F480EF|nr:hypothetical protein [Borrelia sp. A-FGy1]QMU99693.1 hypothetical protein F0310_04575 [Borrelia sp. A-FGy1]